MSWFAAVLPKTSPFSDAEISRHFSRLSKVVGEPYRLSIVSPELILIGGGLPETFAFRKAGDDSGARGWLVCGIGIKAREDSISLMGEVDWNYLFTEGNKHKDLEAMDGHFAAATWNAGRFEVFTDRLELRRVYFSETDQLIAVSTRLDWLVPFLSRPELALEPFSSGWLLINSFTDDSLLKNVTRVGPSGRVLISGGKIEHTWHHWSPGPRSDASILPLLRAATLLPVKEGHRLTLGLSGGMDSRTVLALMLGSDKQYWQVHSCGDTDNPDIAIARVIAEKLRIQHQIQYYNLGKSDTVESITKSLRDYSLHTEMSDSPFGYPRLDLFSKMNREGYWMVDGGYGELLRRSYGNKLLLSNKEAMRTKEFIIDRSRSADVKAYPFYDYGSLLKHVESFYKTTNEKDAQFIEDWLTFD